MVDPSQYTPGVEIVAQGPGLARRKAKAVLDSPNDPEFALWWAAYPRKEGKSVSFVAWEKTRRVRPSIDAMLETLGWQRENQNWKKDGGQYIPMPATYLNQGRWADEPPPRAPTWEEQMQASYDEINERHRALGAKC